MKVAVIIPFLDEAAALPGTLAALAAAGGAAGDVEVIAVDGGSRDASKAELARHAWVRVLDAPRGRATQLNAGARSTAADVLLFLHADTLLPPGALAAIVDAAREERFVYGGFHHAFDGNDWRLRVISSLHNFRCRKARTFYGDQALFVARKAFVEAGGFPVVQVEDIALCQRLREHATPAFLALTVTTSARKFREMGVLRAFAHVLLILLCLSLARPPPQAFFANVR